MALQPNRVPTAEAERMREAQGKRREIKDGGHGATA